MSILTRTAELFTRGTSIDLVVADVVAPAATVTAMADALTTKMAIAEQAETVERTATEAPAQTANQTETAYYKLRWGRAVAKTRAALGCTRGGWVH